MLKILFVHNTLPEYRVAWFQEMSKLCEMRFIITNPTLAEKIYGYQGDKGILDIVYLKRGISGYKQLKSELKHMSRYDFVELPPIDSFGEWLKAIMIYQAARKKGLKVGYFWEKWEAPKEMQNIKRRIKNKILNSVGRTLFTKVDIVFSSGTKNREYFLNSGVEPGKIVVIPDATELS